MKRILFALFVLVAALVPAGAERIARFISDVNVQRSGDLLVTETIQIWAEGIPDQAWHPARFPTTYLPHRRLAG